MPAVADKKHNPSVHPTPRRRARFASPTYRKPALPAVTPRLSLPTQTRRLPPTTTKQRSTAHNYDTLRLAKTWRGSGLPSSGGTDRPRKSARLLRRRTWPRRGWRQMRSTDPSARTCCQHGPLPGAQAPSPTRQDHQWYKTGKSPTLVHQQQPRQRSTARLLVVGGCSNGSIQAQMTGVAALGFIDATGDGKIGDEKVTYDGRSRDGGVEAFFGTRAARRKQYSYRVCVS